MGDTTGEELTGRTLLLFDDQATLKDFADFQSDLLADEVVSTFDDTDVPPEFHWRFSPAYHIGVVPVPPSAIHLRQHAQFGIIAFAPERYLRVSSQIGQFDVAAQFPEEPLKRIGVRGSPATGDTIRVALLDSGVQHPDVEGRVADRKSFVTANGVVTLPHGTLCAGVICGPRNIGNQFGYGIANNAILFDGQIMGTTNIVADDTLLRAIEWADRSKGADVIVFAGGGKTSTNEPNPIFEHVGRLLLNVNSKRLLIVAAGEGSYIAGSSPVEHPANCESIVAVGSVDGNLVAMPSSPGLLAGGDIVNFVAPGFNLPSTSIVSGQPGYGTISGTSAAAAIAGGIACLWAETRTYLRGTQLWQAMMDGTEVLPNTKFQIMGAGLLKAPK